MKTIIFLIGVILYGVVGCSSHADSSELSKAVKVATLEAEREGKISVVKFDNVADAREVLLAEGFSKVNTELLRIGVLAELYKDSEQYQKYIQIGRRHFVLSTSLDLTRREVSIRRMPVH